MKALFYTAALATWVACLCGCSPAAASKEQSSGASKNQNSIQPTPPPQTSGSNYEVIRSGDGHNGVPTTGNYDPRPPKDQPKKDEPPKKDKPKI